MLKFYTTESPFWKKIAFQWFLKKDTWLLLFSVSQYSFYIFFWIDSVHLFMIRL